MKVSDLLEQRRTNWQQLETLTRQMESVSRRKMSAHDVTRFAGLYRAACADLALADSYNLPPNMVQYLHRLVGRAHNQLYRSRKFDPRTWRRVLLEDVPRQIFHDRCVQLAFALFWGMFILAAVLSFLDLEFAESVASRRFLDYIETMHSQSGSGSPIASPAMATFYIQHNTSIGLQCFAGGLLIIPGIAVTLFNAALLGTVFGYMARPEVGATENFFHFVTAHGPFELTAIVLSAGAGLRLGVSLLVTTHRIVVNRVKGTLAVADETSPHSPNDGHTVEKEIALTRSDSLRKTGRETLPIMGSAGIMFFFAALIEGFLSPSAAPYAVKVAVAIVSSLLLIVYFVVLGYPRRATDGT